MAAARVTTGMERGVLSLFLLWLVWLPLPFGSIVPKARMPLLAVPLSLCGIAALVRLATVQRQSKSSRPTRAAIIWAGGGLLFLFLCAAQLIPLPPSIHRTLAPESYRIWSDAGRIATLAGVAGGSGFRPLTVDPPSTRLEVFRIAALLATFVTAALLVRTPRRRVALATVLCATAVFEVLYGLREAALQRFEIWGWVNRLTFNRVTGTFVNPNHFAHYLAIVLPMAAFLLWLASHVSGSEHPSLQHRLSHLLEHHLFGASFAALALLACIAGILLAQSRGALLSLGAGVALVAAMLPGRRVPRVLLACAAGAVLVISLILFLGPERTVGRFAPTAAERETFVGRRVGISAAFGLWKRFPLAGSGAGTFERLVSMEQREDLAKIYHHAHNDYAEIAATTGTLGVTIALVSLFWGYAELVRLTFGDAASGLVWRRRAFQVAALASISIALVHALFDFNFYMPSNPATLAAIAGTAAAAVHHDRRSRRSIPRRT